jgi:hypothetical protein
MTYQWPPRSFIFLLFMMLLSYAACRLFVPDGVESDSKGTCHHEDGNDGWKRTRESLYQTTTDEGEDK